MKKGIYWIKLIFGVLLFFGGLGLIFLPDLMVSLLCPRKALFGLFLLVAGILLFFKDQPEENLTVDMN